MNLWSESDTWGVPLGMEWSEFDQEHVPVQNLLWAPHPPEDAHETAFIGGRGSPLLLYRQHRAGRLTRPQLQRRVGLAWRTCGQPSTELSDDEWAELFGSAGLTVNGWPATVKSMETTVLYPNRDTRTHQRPRLGKQDRSHHEHPVSPSSPEPAPSTRNIPNHCSARVDAVHHRLAPMD